MHVQSGELMLSSSADLDIADWQIDQQAESRLRSYLSGRFTVRDVVYDRQAFVKMADGSGWRFIFAGLSQFSKTLPADQVDAYVLLMPDLDYRARGSPGLSFTAGSSDNLPILRANFSIVILDARTRKIIAQAHARVRPHQGEAAPHLPSMLLSPDIILGKNLTLAPAPRAALQAYAGYLMDKAIIETLRDLGLDDQLPVVGARRLVPIEADKIPFPNIKTVAVASDVGDTLDLEQMVTAFYRTTDFVPVTDWHLDEKVEMAAKQALSRRFTVKQNKDASDTLRYASVTNDNDKPAVRLPGLAPDRQIDAYVLLIKRKVRIMDYLFADGTGIGIARNPVLPSYSPAGETADSATELFANYIVALIDARSLAVLAIAEPLQSPTHPHPRPYEGIEDDAWPGHPPQMTAERSALIRGRLEKMLTDSVTETLMAMGLTGMRVDLEKGTTARTQDVMTGAMQ